MKTSNRINRLLSALPGLPVRSRTVNKLVTGILCLALLVLNGCYLHYYKTNTEQEKNAALLQDLMEGKKFFILHSGSSQRALSGVRMNNGNVEAVIEPLPPEHKKYLRPANYQKNRFPKKEKDIVLREVHLYTHTLVKDKTELSLPLNAFHRVDIYELDEKATKHSAIASTIGIVLTTAGVIAVIVGASQMNDWGFSSASSNSSGSYTCSPEVYAGVGEEQHLAGILYSGAIFAPLKRTDYLPLQGIDVLNDAINLRLRGGKNEELFVQDTRMLQVTHESDLSVLIDQKGKIISYREPKTSRRAMIAEHENVNEKINAKDDRWYSFTNTANERGASDVILDYKKPAGATKGKLVISAKNSTWATYLFRKYKSMYGENYARLVAMKDKADPGKLLQCELDQSLPLSVSIKVGDSWKNVGFFYTPGNEVWRDMIMEIDLSAVANSRQVQVKLETTYIFWDLDFAGMDFSADKSYTQQIASAKLAKKNAVTGVEEIIPTGKIHLSEQEYLDMEFAVQPTTANGHTNSYFLVGTGYYHDNTNYEGQTQLASLARFSQKGAFDKFSREKFDELAAMLKPASANNLTAKQ